MKAIVYGGPGNKAWEDVPEPGIQDPTDAIVKVECTTICGTDLHILKGDVPAVTEGRILGHEGVGVVTEVGPSCTSVTVGDRVIISCISKCMECEYCKAGLHILTARRWAGSGGSSDISSTGRRPSMSECHTGTTGSSRSPTPSLPNKARCSATSCRPATRSGCSTGR